MARYLNTNSLIESVKRRASIPISQNTFKEEDFLAFANEEMDLGVVPLVLQFHEDYLMVPQEVPLVQSETRYEIPSRAIGNKLRDVFYKDTSGTMYELTRVMVEDIPYFQYGSLGAITNPLRAFYCEGSEICLLPNSDYVGPTGSLSFHYYMRPNQLVSESRVTRITSVNAKRGTFTVSNIPTVFSGSSVFDITSNKSPYKLLAYDLVPTDYASTSNLTYTFGQAKKMSLSVPAKASIPTGGYIRIDDNTNGTDVIYIFWMDLTGTDVAPSIPNTVNVRVNLSAAVTDVDVATAISLEVNTALNPEIKSVQTGAVLSIEGGGQSISVGENFAVNSTFITPISTQQGVNYLPKKLAVGDILSLAEETIIPQVPVELHSMLAQRIAMRCLEALGDMQGLQAAAAKLQEMELKTGSVIDNRVEGANLKVTNRTSFLNTTKRYIRR